jgi:dethiobiotin synthetase
MTAYFVTGTDTGVGKTRVSCALLRGLRHTHARCVGMKPVASGCEWVNGRWLNDDVAQLRAASTLTVPEPYDNPYAFPDPIAPHLAAQREGITIDLDHIESCFHALSQQADAVVVEGAGGFMVPLDERGTTMADLAQRLKLPVVLVVGLRLGCLNQALLTHEALLARRLTVAGWVANAVDPSMLHVQANVDTLERALPAPLLAHWLWQPQDKLEQPIALSVPV